MPVKTRTRRRQNDASTEKQWKRLYESAVAFRDQAPWRWMVDEELFAVQDPQHGETAYCCIIGYLGEVRGLAVYRGAEGLEQYRQLRNGNLTPDDPDFLTAQSALLASFNDRDDLEGDDLEIIKRLGLKFRGRGKWPSFRAYRPGYPPDLPNQREAVLLVSALEQAVTVADRVQAGLDLPDLEEDGTLLTRMWDPRAAEWTEALVPPPAPPKPDFPGPADADRMRILLNEQGERTAEAWETDLFFMPTAVLDDETDTVYYPKALLCVERNSGLILGLELTTPWATPDEHRDAMLDLLEKAPTLPSELCVRRQEAHDLLADLAKQLGISLTLRRQLPGIEEAQTTLLQYMSGTLVL